MSVAVLVPVLNRPHRVEPLLDSIADATSRPYRVWFLTDPGDSAEEEAVAQAVARHPNTVASMNCGGNYASKINAGVRATADEFVFLGADDLHFRPEWLQRAAEKLQFGVGVVGVNDLIDRGRDHATHFLLSRKYASLPTIDGRQGPFYEGYSHWYCDDELIATARKRKAYVYAEDAIVEHIHPQMGKAKDDATYRRGRARRRQDSHQFARRSRLWR